ncbi:MAG: Gx transporter family protein [Negativicutes bacterium]|jgi:heptaprenyl diphosphate synthase
MSPNKLTRIALLVVVAAVIQYFENIIYLPVAVPGVKLGFANIITLICVYYLDAGSVVFVAVMRALLGSLIAGALLSPQMCMSMAGALAAALVMVILKKLTINYFSPIGISVAGAVAHILAQLFVASLIIGSFSMYYYLPVAGNLSILTGILNGYVFCKMRRILTKIFY